MKNILSLLVLFLLSTVIIAQESSEAKIEEFFSVETAWVQEKKELQLTVKPSLAGKTISFPFQIEYGLTNRLQIHAELPGDGWQEAGFLYHIAGKQHRFFVSAGVDIETNLFSKTKVGEEKEIEWQPVIHLAKTMGRLELHGSLLTSISKEECTSGYEAAAVVSFGNWRATGELNGSFSGQRYLLLTSGLLWKGWEGFELGAGITKSITGKKEQVIMLMATYEFSFGRKGR